MRSRPKVTRILLEPETVKDFSLYGIVSTEPDYRLSLSINRAFKVSLKNDSPVITKKNNTFSRFSFRRSGNDTSWNLISNKSGDEFLLGKYRKIDYFLQISPATDPSDPNKISQALRMIDSVTAVFLLDPDEVIDKNFHYLIP